jgi:hypothetical protein
MPRLKLGVVIEAQYAPTVESFCPPPSFTTKQASNSSTVQGGGKRRGDITPFHVARMLRGVSGSK